MASVQVWSLQVLLLLLTTVSGVVCADDYSIGGLVAAAGVAFIFLAIVITMIVVGFTWNSWYPDFQRSKGKVKMPREYWKKKEEAKRRLLNGSRTALTSLAAPSENGLPNGAPPSRIQDTGVGQASWVQGWNNANAASDRGYEEMALAMDLGDEKDDEFRIETTVVDNETLDLGPFKDSDGQGTGTGTGTGTATAGTSQQTATMEMTEEVDDGAYLYSVVDPARKSSEPTGGENPADAPEAVTSFSKLGHHLVAL